MALQYSLLKCVSGSYNQGDARFGSTAGMQCSCISLYSLFYTCIKSISRWDGRDLDEILVHGDILFKSLGMHTYLSVDDLPHELLIGEIRVPISFLELYTGEVTLTDIHFLDGPFSRARCQSCLFIIQNFTTAIVKYLNKFYIFDSHSRDRNGHSTISGFSVLLTFEDILNVEGYIIDMYLISRNVRSVYFQLQFLDFNVSSDVERVVKLRSTRFRNTARYITRNSNVNIIKEKKCSKTKIKTNPEKRSSNKRGSSKVMNGAGTYNKADVECNIDIVNKFKGHVRLGPFYICVCCNRCMYKQSVKSYSPHNYCVSEDDYSAKVHSFDKCYYICGTCHQNLKKKRVPAQSVHNKLEIYDLPYEFHDIRLLEKILIAKRILFKKVALSHRGQFPKMKGSICNIPIDDTQTVTSLPRASNSNGLVLVKLKRKLCYKGHVLFEGVRPSFLYAILDYLKSNNSLYEDVEICNTELDADLIDENNSTDVDLLNDITLDIPLLLEKDSQNLETQGIESENVEDPLPVLNSSTSDFDLLNDITLDIPVILENDSQGDESENVEDPLSVFKSSCSETMLMQHMPTSNEIDGEILNLAPGEGKIPIDILMDEHCEELAHPHLFPTGKFGCQVKRDIPLTYSRYFNQRLLNYSQKFSSDPDYIFYALSVLQQNHLRGQINFAMKKVAGANFTAGMVSQNFRDKVKSFIATDKAYSFMAAVPGTPAYWKKFLHEVLAMVKQLGTPSYFLTLSCADLRWNELVAIISKLKGVVLSEDEIEMMSYQERCKLLNSNPVLLARHFQYRVETFFKDIVVNGPLGETLYYAIRVEFQMRGSPHIHSFIWVKDVPSLNSDNKEVYIQHIDANICAELPSDLSNEKLYDSVATFQLHRHSKTCTKYGNTACRFGFGKYFTKKTIVAEPIADTLDSDEKLLLLKWRAELLKKVKDFINENLNPRKVNFFNKTLDSYKELPSCSEILFKLGITEDDYYKALSISDDGDYQIHLKRQTNSCFVNNYFPVGLLAWEANIDIQPVYNHFKAITYMCSYMSKSEDECSEAMATALKEAYQKESDYYSQMKVIAKAYISKREVSVQEAAYLCLTELWLRKIFPAVVFANSNIPEKRYRVFLPEKELKELPDDSKEIFRKNMIDRYIDRPDEHFNNGRYTVINSMCFGEFLRYYVNCKSKSGGEGQPDELPEEIVESNHSANNYPTKIPLMSSKEKLNCRKVPCILRYHIPNRTKNPEAYAHHVLFLFYPFRKEEDLLSENGSYVEKLREQGVTNVIVMNQQRIEPFAEGVDEAYETFLSSTDGHPLDSFGQQENDDNTTEGNYADIRQSAPASIDAVPMINLPDHDINVMIRSLNFKQREVFDFVIQWCIDLVKNSNLKKLVKLEAFYLFLSGGGGVGKSHLINTICYAATKIFMYKSGDVDKKRVLLLAPTGVAAIHINGTTIHTGLVIPTTGKLYPLSDKSKVERRLSYSCVELIIIDEISMVSARLFRDVDARLREIFGSDEPFGGKSVLLCGDLYQLPPVNGKPVFSFDFTAVKDLIGSELWRMFLLAELTEVMRQKGDNRFVNLLNQVRVGLLDEENEVLLKSKFCHDKTSHPDITRIYAENAPVDAYNRTMLDKLEGHLFSVNAIDECNASRTDLSLLSTAKPSQTGGLAYQLELKVGAKVMLTKNINIDDRLINGQVGHIRYFHVVNSKLQAIYVEFVDTKAGNITRQADNMIRTSGWTKIERMESVFQLRQSSNFSTVRRTQFPLMLAWACTVHKVQGLSLPSAVISFELFRQRYFNAGQMYVALSRVTNIDGLHLTGTFSKDSIKINSKAHEEYERLRKENLFQPMKKFEKSCKSLTICLLNTRSLLKHAIDIIADVRLSNTDILCLTETHLNADTSVEQLHNCLVPFRVKFNSQSDHKFDNIALCHQDDVNVSEILLLNGISIYCIDKPSFSNKRFKIAVVYRRQNAQRDVFLNCLLYIIDTYHLDMILGDFNINATHSGGLFEGYRMIVEAPTQMSGGVLDHVYVKEEVFKEMSVQTIVYDVFFSDHDAVCFQLQF